MVDLLRPGFRSAVLTNVLKTTVTERQVAEVAAEMSVSKWRCTVLQRLQDELNGLE